MDGAVVQPSQEVTMHALTNGKTRRSASEWREILDRFHRSGLSARAFCKRESLVVGTFHRWRKQLATDGDAEARGPEFVEVASSGERFPAFWAVEVELPDGRILRMRG